MSPGPAEAQDARACAGAFDLAQQARDEGKYRRAREQFVACAKNVCPSEIRNDCVLGVTEVDKDAPTVVIAAKDGEGRDLLFVRVYVDGQRLLDRLDGRPVMIDAGPHSFRYEADGAPSQEDQVVIRTGEKNRVLSVQLAVPSRGPGSTASTSSESPEPRSRSRGVPAATWILGGVAAVAFASEAIFGLSAISGHADCRRRMNTANGCTDSEVDAVATKVIVADVSLLVGLVSAGLGAYLYFSQRSPEPAAAAPRHPVRVQVSATQGGGFAGFGLPF